MRPLCSFFPCLRLGALLALALAVVVSAQAATVQGRLQYKNGSPASDIAVRLTTPAGAAVTAFSYSVRDGRYFVQNVGPGTYRLEIWRNRVLVISRPITVAEPSLVVASLTLP